MRIAFGISAYKDAYHLKCLIDALQGENKVFFIHIDKKCDITPFKNNLLNISNCIFSETRYNVQWGGWNQVRYQLLFLKMMLEYTPHIDRLFVISGQDYPLWSNYKIEKECLENPDKIWMKGINLTKMPSESHMKRFLGIPHYFRDVNFHSSKIRHYITGGQRELFLKLVPSLRKKHLTINEKQWDIWQSSGYFSCNREVAKYIVETFEKYPQIESYFKYSFVPEEITIPTIIFNSKYKEFAEVFPRPNYEGLSSLATLHEFYYSDAIKVYQEDDFKSLILSKKMFCRKNETGKSDGLIKLLDEYRADKQN